mmetsp:Transcript_49392/g.63362  ORF Transcript_49392/g.63362 Transcript_49392/m.63362 type:complete len:164 (-) Transcript_49392:121-612(-)
MANSARIVGGALVGGYLLYESIYRVTRGERAIIFDKFQGVLPEPVTEGIHFKLPFIQDVRLMNIRVRPIEVKTEHVLKDSIPFLMTTKVLYAPKSDKVTRIFVNLGLEFGERIMPLIVAETMNTILEPIFEKCNDATVNHTHIRQFHLFNVQKKKSIKINIVA